MTFDEWYNQDWREKLASSPSSFTRGNSEKGNEQMLELQRRQVPTGNDQTAKGITFLKPQHATKEGVTASITKVTTDKKDNFGNPVVVYYSIAGAKYSKGYKLSSDNLASHVDVLGADETKWAKKSIKVFKVTDDEGSERLAFGKA